MTGLQVGSFWRAVSNNKRLQFSNFDSNSF